MNETQENSDGASPRHPAPATAEEVFQLYGPRVYNLARRMLGSDADAEDVTQDVLLQVIRKLPTFRGESAFPTWLHRVTVNAALSHRQKRAQRQQREVHDPLDALFEDGSHHHPVRGWSVGPEDQALSHETQRLIDQAIADLPEHYRDVFVLADVEGLPNAEIAGMLGDSISAVKNRLHRARVLMRHALAPHFEEALTR
ncbi:MAG TPA: RNA polymerase sigma factor [Gemmataceae bacterium]|nr:RNA polymerase sigma factor [Gemmataceae bacterium]